MMMTDVALAGLVYHPHRIRHIIGCTSLVLALLHPFGVYSQFHHGA
jgi:hypothetical protein